MKKFNYVIARKHLCGGAIGQLNPFSFYNAMVFFGDMEDAKKMLKFVRENEPALSEDYEIYWVDNSPLNPF